MSSTVKLVVIDEDLLRSTYPTNRMLTAVYNDGDELANGL